MHGNLPSVTRQGIVVYVICDRSVICWSRFLISACVWSVDCAFWSTWSLDFQRSNCSIVINSWLSVFFCSSEVTLMLWLKRLWSVDSNLIVFYKRFNTWHVTTACQTLPSDNESDWGWLSLAWGTNNCVGYTFKNGYPYHNNTNLIRKYQLCVWVHKSFTAITTWLMACQHLLSRNRSSSSVTMRSVRELSKTLIQRFQENLEIASKHHFHPQSASVCVHQYTYVDCETRVHLLTAQVQACSHIKKFTAKMDIMLVSVNSLHAEVIYAFQFSKAEIARNQRCHSEGQSWQAR